MIAGAVIGLRAIERDDLATLLAWRNRADFRRFFREYRELGPEQQETWYRARCARRRSHRACSAIVESASGQLIGACGVCYIDWVNRTADFSIYIGHDGRYIDELYAADAGRTLLGYGFDELGLHRIWCEIYEFDVAKQRLLAGLGFSLDGRHRETHWAEGAWHDSLFYGILDREHAARRRPAERAA